jgi:hypothetical protein
LAPIRLTASSIIFWAATAGEVRAELAALADGVGAAPGVAVGVSCWARTTVERRRTDAQMAKVIQRKGADMVAYL